jgi:hypothetical protein
MNKPSVDLVLFAGAGILTDHIPIWFCLGQMKKGGLTTPFPSASQALLAVPRALPRALPLNLNAHRLTQTSPAKPRTRLVFSRSARGRR